MHKRSRLHIALSLTAIAGWLLFILGCTGWPAWSPNGSKILFTYAFKQDGETKMNIALYDLPTGQVRTLFKCPEGEPCSAQWRSTGTSALIFANDGDKKVAIFDVPIDDSGLVRRVASIERTDGLLPPVPEVNGALFLSGNPPARIDLDSGAAQTLPELADSLLYPWNGERALYVRTISRDDSNGRYEVGELRAGTGSREPLYEFATSDPALGRPKDLGFPATDPERSRFAMIAQHKERDEILLFERTGFRRILKPKMPPGDFHLGNMEWARDGQSIFASVVQPLKDDDAQWSLAEISLRSGSVRLVPIARLKISDSDFFDTLPILLEISLSPDGHTIAASSGIYDPDNIAPADRGLFLIDVGSRDEKRVTKIPISSLVPGASQ